MSRYWSQSVHQLKPYIPGEQLRREGVIKLNTNELPMGPAPSVLSAIKAAATADLRLYPDPQVVALRETLADYHDVKPDQIFVGNGSDEVLAHIFQGLLKQDAPLLLPDISYSFYPVYCQLYNISYQSIALDAEFQLNVAAYQGDVGAIIFPNPNAPTGLAIGLDDIITLLEMHPDAPIVIDEAYVDFGAETAVQLVDRYPNLLVVRTMSKSRGLAGLRVGYAVGHADLIEALVRVKDSFNSYPLDHLAQIGAIASVKDEGYFQACRQTIMENRDMLLAGLTELGFVTVPSSANFLFTYHPKHDAATVAKKLRDSGILVRHFTSPRVEQYLRITVGTKEEISSLLSKLQQILS